MEISRGLQLGYLQCLEDYETKSEALSANSKVKSASGGEDSSSLAKLAALRDEMVEYILRNEDSIELSAKVHVAKELVRALQHSLISLRAYFPAEEEPNSLGNYASRRRHTESFSELERKHHHLRKRERTLEAENKMLARAEAKLLHLVEELHHKQRIPSTKEDQQVELESLLQAKLRNLQRAQVTDLAEYSRVIQVDLTKQWLNRIQELRQRVKRTQKANTRLEQEADYLKNVLHFHAVIHLQRPAKQGKLRNVNENNNLAHYKDKLEIVLEKAAQEGPEFCRFAAALLRSRFFLKRRIPMVDVLRVVYRNYTSIVASQHR